MDVYLNGVLWVVGAAALAGATAYLVRRYGLDEGRADNNDAAGQVFTIIGGLHAVLVAFVLISLFDGANQAKTDSYTEANNLVAASWAADALPGDTGAQVRALEKQYAVTVIEQEWPTLEAGDDVTGPGWAQLDDLRRTVAAARIDDGDDWQTGRKTEAADKLWDAHEARQSRVTDGGGIGAVVWFALALGSVISVMLPNLFGGTRMATHVIIVSTLAGTIALLLFAIYQLQNPFSGGAKVEPDAFRSLLDRMADQGTS